MPTLSVNFYTTATEAPTLGYIVSYRRVGVDASPTFFPVNSQNTPNQNGIVSIELYGLTPGFQYEVTVQPQCSPTSVGTLLTFTKILPVTITTGRDPSSSAAACAAAKNIILYARQTVTSGVQLYTTPDVDSVNSTTLSITGWYSDGAKAYNVNSSGIVTSVVDCV
jgi:hypothetical protein